MDPGNLFSFGTVPCGPDTLDSDGCELLSGKHMRAMFHDCWKKWRADKSQEIPEESEELVEQSEDDAEEGHHAAEEEEQEAVEEHSFWHFTKSGCLWMWVLWRHGGNGRRGLHAVEGLRYLTFADMWAFIMREPASLMFFEEVCRMAAADDCRTSLAAHAWYGKVSHWTDGAYAEDSAEAQFHETKPGSASSLVDSDQQKRAAGRWLRQAARAQDDWTGPIKMPDRRKTKERRGDGEEGDGEEDEEKEEGDEEEGEEEEGGEGGAEDDEEEAKETDDESDAESGVDSWASCVTATNCATRDSPRWLRTPRKVLSDQDFDTSQDLVGSDSFDRSHQDSSDECQGLPVAKLRF